MIENIEFELTLIRHGQSMVNVQPDLMGQEPDIELTSLGKHQAFLLGKRLNHCVDFDKIYSSPYKRALDTAQIATQNALTIHLGDDLREYHAGDWINASRSQTITPVVLMKMNTMDHGFCPPNGESLHMVERRASVWLENNILYNKDMQNLYIKLGKPLKLVVFSHGMTIKSLLHYVMGFDKSFTWKIEIENTGITKLSFGKFGWKLDCINDHAHLE